MKITKLIDILEKVKIERGDCNIVLSAFGQHVGLSDHFVTYSIDNIPKNLKVSQYMNSVGKGEFSIGIKIRKSKTL